MAKAVLEPMSRPGHGAVYMAPWTCPGAHGVRLEGPVMHWTSPTQYQHPLPAMHCVSELRPWSIDTSILPNIGMEGA